AGRSGLRSMDWRSAVTKPGLSSISRTRRSSLPRPRCRRITSPAPKCRTKFRISSRCPTGRRASSLPVADELAAIFRRDLTRLLQELHAFPSDEVLWAKLPGISNSAGHLFLHLEGNQREYIGSQ